MNGLNGLNGLGITTTDHAVILTDPSWPHTLVIPIEVAVSPHRLAHFMAGLGPDKVEIISAVRKAVTTSPTTPTTPTTTERLP